ncbi:MAG: virulence-associated E family protein [Lachnospiraceae bacterium]|nr:virulence-associated E family protein [Lachnospiraceae bacterium]
MDLKYDRQLNISVGNSRKDISWKSQTIKISELWDKLKIPNKGTETLDAFMKLKKAQQDDLKDVGGFMAGSLNGGRRKASAVTGRDIVTLDFDTIPAYGTDNVLQSVANLGYGYAVYSTRKHLPTAPRLRILIPLDRTVTADEYEPIARHIAAQIGIQMADPTTFEACRLMYWPSCSLDSEYIYQYADAPLAPADSILSSYADWHDFNSWPQVPGSVSYQKLAMKQGDPDTKPGIVGAFNRAYGGVLSAMGTLIPGIYEQCDNDPNRYTYLGGSTTGGAIIYDDGKFLFSHHGTDPCSGKLVNAFDLVRLHKFGDQDDTAQAGTPNNRLPSYKAMCEFAVADPTVSALMAQERRDQAVKDFDGVPADNSDDAVNWMQKLDLNPKTAQAKPTIDNVLIILDNDPLLKGKFALNQFAGRGEVLGNLPWSSDSRRRLWSDTDSNGLYWYLEKTYNITGRGNIDAALDIHAATHAFNEVQNYLKKLDWDGINRLDTLFIDYLGAQDSEYNRAVCRKSFTAAVARAMEPGCKYDNMLILCGSQGIGKSTLLDKMSRGWFNDSIRTFEGKEASELLQGVWLVEVAELDAFRRTDVARIKQFLSLRADRYRAAYGRNVKELPRCCVFFGTCNQMDFLQDTTGNRRFWPVDVGEQEHTKNVWRDLTDEIINQLWAEAKARWQLGEATYLTGSVEKAAKDKQEQHREASPKEGLIQEFVARKVPSDWSTWTLDRRRDYWAGNAQGGTYELVERDRICTIEVWCELFFGSQKDIKPTDSREINATISNISGWKRSEKVLRCGPYNTQRGFVPR